MPNKSKPKAKSGGDSRGTFTRVDDAADDGDVPHDPREVPGLFSDVEQNTGSRFGILIWLGVVIF